MWVAESVDPCVEIHMLPFMFEYFVLCFDLLAFMHSAICCYIIRCIFARVEAKGRVPLSPVPATESLNTSAVHLLHQARADGLWFLKHSTMDRNEGVTCYRGRLSCTMFG